MLFQKIALFTHDKQERYFINPLFQPRLSFYKNKKFITMRSEILI